MLAGGFTALRIFFGAVWLSNGLAKAIGRNTFDWGFFQWFLTVAELTVGVTLLFGIASRFGAVIGLLLIGPIWIMFWIMLLPRNQYLWDYPLDLFPLLVLAIVPAGRTLGLAARSHGRWPFS